MCAQRSEVTPDVRPAVGGGGGAAAADVGLAEGELGLALLRRGRVLGQELHDVQVLLVAADAAFADDVHDAGQHVARAAAEAAAAGRTGRLLLLARVQDLRETERPGPVRGPSLTEVNLSLSELNLSLSELKLNLTELNLKLSQLNLSLSRLNLSLNK